MRGRDLSQFTKGEIYALHHHANWSYQHIATALNISKSTVSKFCQRSRQPLPLPNLRRNCKRPRITGDRYDRAVERTSVTDRMKTACSISRELSNIKAVSHDTVNRRLNKCGLKAHVPAVKPLLTVPQQQTRLQWALEQQRANRNWSEVIFSDESTFLVSGSSAGFVRRRRGERLLPECVTAVPNVSTGRCMIWGAFCRDGYCPLVRIEERMNSERYTDMLNDSLLPFYYNISNIVNISAFLQDNAPIHVSQHSINWFRENDIPLIPWPPYSPDCNPIENVWSQMKKRLALLHQQPTSSATLFQVVSQIWEDLMHNDIFRHKLCDSMNRRIAAVITSGGGYTKY